MSRNSNSLDALLQRPRPNLWQQFLHQPIVFLATKLYNWRPSIIPQPLNPITVVCISDTHGSQPSLPAGEILIHAGDLTQSGTHIEIQNTLSWLHQQPHPHKIVIAGNHDILLDPSQCHASSWPLKRETLDWGNLIYLSPDSPTTTITCSNGRKLKIHGNPLTPRHGNWAFQYPRNHDPWRDQIPQDTDILITHGPPKGHLDTASHYGCIHLLREVWRVKPRVHVFGHIHDGYGTEYVQYDELQRAHEDVVIAGGGLLNFGRVVLEFVKARLGSVKEARGVMVNAAIVGGLRDEQRRRAVIVDV